MSAPSRAVGVHRGGVTVDVALPDAPDLLSGLRAAGVAVESVCGGRGTCGKCLVRLAEGAAPVLACRQAADGVTEVWLEETPPLVIEAGFAGPAWTPPPDPAGGCAIAVDIGTTTVVAALADLATGEVLATVADRNDQAAFGADVIARIGAATAGGLDALVTPLREQVAGLAAYLLDRAGVDTAAVRRYAVAGNTVMEHFLAGLSPASIGQAPFTPLSLFGDERPASSLGLPGPAAAPVYLSPAVAGYVGGDITAGLWATARPDAGPDDVTLFLDLGTNGELALRAPAGVTVCATAAGPAFEGAEIECGSPAVTGAIDRVRVAAGLLRVTTIGHAPPLSICGSGLFEALAAALALGLVDETGRLRARDEVAPHLAQYLAPDGEPPALRLVPDGPVYLSQADIRRLQLAKSALAAGIAVLLADAGVAAADVTRVELAGGFGTHVRPAALAAIGLIPTTWTGRTHAVGNASLAGALRACYGGDTGGGRAALEGLARRCRYLELSSDPRFTDAFVDAMAFPDPGLSRDGELRDHARDLGFAEAAPLRLGPGEGRVALAPQAWVREMCAQNRCRAFGSNWMCPPALPPLGELAEDLAAYRRGLLVQTVGRLDDAFDYEGMVAAERAHKRRFRRLVADLRPAYPRLTPLGAGACDLCPACSYPAEPCRLPGLAHASMEASGLDVTAVCRAAGVPYYHGPDSVTYTSLVLLE
ncbi:MAG: ASKHA domain-containing protein [Propionibacteriaceae bacterium]|jgi:uncharacterized 2Fe-2S/4Fe-4S cluster protein (DUF4445 family)/predicted metal-binding protein|nr:ASKHA domain-containing protein [Propionibacteriaceae bacterium]